MFIAYIITLALTVILLFSAVCLHFFLGLHRGIKTKVKKVRVVGRRVGSRHHWHVSHLHAPNLHEHIFRTSENF